MSDSETSMDVDKMSVSEDSGNSDGTDNKGQVMNCFSGSQV
jgi:hypothetical protein